MSLNKLSIFELQSLIQKKEIKVSELVKDCISQISDRDEQVKAWVDFNSNDALKNAELIDNQDQLLGPLHGIPVGMKDIIDVSGISCSRGSIIYSNRIATTDAHIVSLIKGAGSFVLGKTITTEFASGNPNVTCNPHNLDYTPGGSSSGSAAAVADYMVPYAFGTQTAGSMIRPAAFCGIPAIKPSFGTISRAGLSYVADSLDTIGWFARDVRDLGIVYNALTGNDVRFDKDGDLKKLKIGICKTPDWDNAENLIQDLFEELEINLSQSNIQYDHVELPKEFSLLGEVQNRIMCKEMTFWLEDEWANHHSQLSAYIIERLDFGKTISSEQILLDNILLEHSRKKMTSLFDDYDFIITPSAPGPAPEGLLSTGNSVFNRMWTALHLPCVNIPIKKSENGLPIGVQIVGKFKNDATLLESAKFIQDFISEQY
ncbi:MAG: amidase [Chloroflexi bacterium]|nr:amidase [Chloroflexota bacterium]|tara:strand:- start:6497 stop:7786 length:1290 start_codon:yes stop_codon:yes gene_type:complete